MAKKAPRFVRNFVGDYFGETPDDFANNLLELTAKARRFHALCERDIHFVTELLKAKDVSETRRIYIRSVPPYVEGVLNVLRVTPYLYPPLLRRIPESCAVDFAEPVLPLKNRTKTKDAVRKTLVGFGVVAGVDFSNHVMGERGAQCLMATFDIRDRLMHPRSLENLGVTDYQLQQAKLGVEWFRRKVSLLTSSLEDVVAGNIGASKQRTR